MRTLILLASLVPVIAAAGPPHSPGKIDLELRQNQHQSQALSSSPVATGGNIGGISADTNVFALAGNITQVEIEKCMVPAKGRGRSMSFLWGLFSISGYATLESHSCTTKPSSYKNETR